MTRKIVCAGLNRSGSTLIYNAVRCVISEKYGSEDIYACIIDDYDDARTEEWHIVKAHDSGTIHRLKFDVLFTSFRDIRAVAGSLLRMGWLLDKEDQITVTLDNYITNLRYLSRNADLCLKYEDFCRNPEVIVKAVMPLIGIDQDIAFEERVVAKLASLRPAANTPTGDIASADSQTMLHHGHIGGIDNHVAISLLSVDSNEFIETRYSRWLLEHGYDVTKKSIVSRLFELEDKLGPNGMEASPELPENVRIICDRNAPENLLLSGFQAEEWGAWSVGDIAAIRFSTPLGFGSGSLKLSIGALTPDATPPLVADVYVNGEYVDTWYWRGSLDQVIYSVPISGRERHVVTFVLKGARSPASIGIGADGRKLGMALREITLVS